MSEKIVDTESSVLAYSQVRIFTGYLYLNGDNVLATDLLIVVKDFFSNAPPVGHISSGWVNRSDVRGTGRELKCSHFPGK